MLGIRANMMSLESSSKSSSSVICSFFMLSIGVANKKPSCRQAAVIERISSD